MTRNSGETHSRETMDAGPHAGTLDQAFHALLEPLRAALTRIEQSLHGRPFPAPPPIRTSSPSTPEQRETTPPAAGTATEILQRLDTLQSSLTQLWERVTLALDSHTPDPSPAEEVSNFDSMFDQPEQWEQVLLDDDLASPPSLADCRRQFLLEVLDGNPAARILAGHLMIVRSADVQDLPEMLRHVGEAYYRWHPRAFGTPDDPWEEALAQWLNRLLERAGLPNSIQLVGLGERYDSARHIASSRGVEIVAVHGWVVLRDRTRVYTRANVTLK